ncbi:hypothetical protein K474DRAFT_1713269 [Panus rudis PR-1116 ss-1]|nr:hypothetical protein K474DRAFT_1713269 [Panus rudis PR-1116 ss-1]
MDFLGDTTQLAEEVALPHSEWLLLINSTSSNPPTCSLGIDDVLTATIFLTALSNVLTPLSMHVPPTVPANMAAATNAPLTAPSIPLPVISTLPAALPAAPVSAVDLATIRWYRDEEFLTLLSGGRLADIPFGTPCPPCPFAPRGFFHVVFCGLFCGVYVDDDLAKLAWYGYSGQYHKKYNVTAWLECYTDWQTYGGKGGLIGMISKHSVIGKVVPADSPTLQDNWYREQAEKLCREEDAAAATAPPPSPSPPPPSPPAANQDEDVAETLSMGAEHPFLMVRRGEYLPASDNLSDDSLSYFSSSRPASPTSSSSVLTNRTYTYNDNGRLLSISGIELTRGLRALSSAMPHSGDSDAGSSSPVHVEQPSSFQAAKSVDASSTDPPSAAPPPPVIPPTAAPPPLAVYAVIRGESPGIYFDLQSAINGLGNHRRRFFIISHDVNNLIARYEAHEARGNVETLA